MRNNETVKQRDYEMFNEKAMQNYERAMSSKETTKQRNSETRKERCEIAKGDAKGDANGWAMRNNETTKLQNNETAKGRDSPIRTP